MSGGFFLVLFGCGPPGMETGLCDSVVLAPKEAVSYLIRIVFFCMLFFPLFYLRLMGGGDVKWIAFLIGSLGTSSGIFILFYGCICGVFYALYKRLFAAWDRTGQKKRGVPLVTGLFFGYLWYLIKAF